MERAGPAPVIVKLGGSVITRKREVERLRPKVLARLGREVSATRTPPRVLLHGAGGFGHPGAARWELTRPPRDGGPDRVRGAAIVQSEVRRLHYRVLQAVLEGGGDPVSVPAASVAENREGRLARLDSAPFARALGSGAIPVSFGDVVPDSAWGFSVLSADAIARSLAEALRPSRVLFVSDVPGVFVDPGRRGKIHPELSASVAASLAPHGAGPDVTGGILGKVRAMLEIAGLGVDACLISGLADGSLSRAIEGENVYGSWAHGAGPEGRRPLER